MSSCSPSANKSNNIWNACRKGSSFEDENLNLISTFDLQRYNNDFETPNCILQLSNGNIVVSDLDSLLTEANCSVYADFRRNAAALGSFRPAEDY